MVIVDTREERGQGEKRQRLLHRAIMDAGQQLEQDGDERGPKVVYERSYA